MDGAAREAGGKPGESGVTWGRTGVWACGRAAAHRLSAPFSTSARLCACTLLAACASAGDPPGGPPDEEAPQVVSSVPDSGAVLDRVPGEAVIIFNEVISERVAGTPPTISGAVLVSPSPGETRVSWKRSRLEVRPSDGFRPGRIYRVELLPVVTDLRQNRIAQGRVIVFSTGPAIPSAALDGAVADWAGGRAAPRALIEAVLLPDSLSYRTYADSTGYFDMRQMPAGSYLVYGIMDTNGDKRRGAREAFDSVRVELAETGRVELFAFPHDTIGPRIRQVELQDSLTIKLTFDRPIDPTFAFDTALVTLTTDADTTARLPFLGIATQAGLDSLREAADAARRAARADSGEPAPAPTPARPPAATPGRAPAQPAGRQGARRAPLDSTLVQRMLVRRPAPTDVRFLRLERPLEIEVRYVIILEQVRGLTGAVSRTRSQIRVPQPRVSPVTAPPPGARDSSARDSTRADTTTRDTAAVRP